MPSPGASPVAEPQPYDETEAGYPHASLSHGELVRKLEIAAIAKGERPSVSKLQHDARKLMAAMRPEFVPLNRVVEYPDPTGEVAVRRVIKARGY